MAKQTSSKRATSKSEAPAPITKIIAKAEKPVASGIIKATVPSAPASKPAPTHAAIALRAYELSQMRSHHEGSQESDWLRAEHDLRA